MIFGANVEVGAFGIVVPLTEGVFNPYEGEVNARGHKIARFTYAGDGKPYHETASVAHRAQGYRPVRQWIGCHCARTLAHDEVGR